MLSPIGQLHSDGANVTATPNDALQKIRMIQECESPFDIFAHE